MKRVYRAAVSQSLRNTGIRCHGTRLQRAVTEACKIIVAFPALPVFKKLTDTWQHYKRICYTELHQIRTVNVDSADMNYLTLFSTLWFSFFRILQNAQLLDSIV